MREITGKKVWLDSNDLHGWRPDSITVTLYADGQALDLQPTWSGTKGNPWTYSFGSLPAVNADGSEISYTVRETPVEGYETSISGLTITNRLIERQPESYRDFDGVKTWNDNDNANGKRPGHIVVRLYRDGVEFAKREVTAGSDWSYSFGNLPEDDGYGHSYTYEVREDAVPGYFTRINGMNVTNTLLDDTPAAPDTQGTTGEGELVPTGRIPNRNTGTPAPGFEGLGEQELEELFDLFGYGTPLWGELMPTGDETPAWPFAFAGAGLMALLAVLFIGKKRRRA